MIESKHYIDKTMPAYNRGETYKKNDLTVGM